MSAPPTFEEFEAPVRRVSPKEREAAASATKAEAAADVAPELTQAQLRAAKLQGDKLERDLAGEDEGKKAAEGKAAAAQSKAVADREQAMLLLKLIQRARDSVSAPAATGIPAQITGGLFGSPAKDLEGALEPIRSDVVLDAMAQARIGSAVGATGFGALDRGERAMLASSRGSLAGDQSPEKLLESLDNIDRIVRIGLAREAGYDPYSPEGAAMFGLPMPETTADLPLPSTGDVTTGRWDKRPELAGIDAAVTSMIKAGRSAGQIRQYLNEFQPGLGDKATNIEGNIDYHKKTGKDPGVTLERYFVQEEPGIAETITDNPVGAGVQAALNEASLGVSGLIPGETGQQIRAAQRGLADQYPTATTIGGIAGGVASGITGVGLAGKTMKLPGILEGVGQEAFRGAAMAEPGERLGGAAEGSLTAIGGNVLLKPVAGVVGGVLKGATKDAATLSQKYGVNLSPGQLTGVDEATAAGLPLVGGQVQARRNESLVDFNKAAFNEVLKPIGASVDAIGQKGVAETQDAVIAAYNRALGGRVFQFDTPFVSAVRGAPYATLASMKGDQGPKAAGEIDRILNEINVNGAVDGRAWQQARRQLVDLQSAGEIKDAIGGTAIIDSVGDIIDAFDDLVKRQAPDVFEDYMAANTAYRGTKVLERAVDFAPRGDVFGPGNLRSATRQNTAKFGGSAASARGERPLNELVMAGLNVIPDRVDEVSLAGRLLPGAAGAGAGVGAVSLLPAPSDSNNTQNEGSPYFPPELLAAAAGVGLASLPYSRRGTGLANALMGGQRNANQQMLGDLISRYSPAALRGGFIGGNNEFGVPMPQEEVSTDLVISPEMREALLGAQAPAGYQGVTPEGFDPGYEDAAPVEDGNGMSTVTMGGREVFFDSERGAYVDAATGEPVEGYNRGGEVSWQERQRAQQGRVAAARRQQDAGVAQARDTRTAPARERVAAASPANRQAAMRSAQQRPQTSALTDLTMAASRRSNDLVAALADLADHYGVSPANAAAWAAENIEGRSPEQVAMIRRNLQPLGSNREIINAGALSNERRFREAGGLGARPEEEAYTPVEMGAVAYRPQDVPRALVSEVPRWAFAAGDYLSRNSAGTIASDAERLARTEFENMRKDPYGYGVEGAVYSAFPLLAGTGDYAAVREGSRMLDPYTKNDAEARDAKRMVDALSALPLAGGLGVRRAKRARGGPAKRKR